MILAKSGLIRPLKTFEAILHLIKNLRIYNVDIPEKLLKDQALKKKYSAEKMILKF